MRSLLFVPADSSRKLDRALGSGADAIILDLEDSVGADRKEEARRSALAFLREARTAESRPDLYVRVNGLDSPLNEGDLDIVMTAAPDGIMLPKATSGADIALTASRLSVREALHGWDDGATRILPLTTESGAALFGMASYAESSPRLVGLTWGAEDLSADVGAAAARVEGEWTAPFQLARSLCLFAAAAACVPAIDTVYADFRDLAGFRRECEAARRDGFSAKLAIHPDQVAVINETFAPAPDAVARAERVVAAFSKAHGAGVVSLDGAMLDRPHLVAAERLLARSKRA